MYYIIHLAAPIAIALVVVLISGATANWIIADQIEKLANTYMMFAVPHWIWAALTAYTEASRRTTEGGFIGAHILLIAVGIFVMKSHAPESANGWFLYLIGSPLAILIGALIGRQFARRGNHAS